MKQIYLILAALVLVLTGCETYLEPISDFSASSSYVEPNEPVVFTNYSTEAESVEWDFGDGSTSNAFNPSHRYYSEGVYEVRLAVYNHGWVDYSYFTIEVLYTTLEIQVYDIKTNELIANLPVELYFTEYDWQRGSKMVAKAYTDQTGSVVFKELQDREYFMWAVDNIYTNELLIADDINYVRTLPLLWARHNVFKLAVEYLPIVGVYKQMKLTEKSAGERIETGRVKTKSNIPYKDWKNQLKK